MGLPLGARLLVEGCFRDGTAKHEVLEAFHDCCGSKSRGTTANLALMMLQVRFAFDL